MYGAELKPSATVLVDPPPDEHIRLTNAVLVKRPKAKNARVVVQIGDPEASEVQVAFAVLSQATDNVPLDVVINSPMVLRITGQNISGAVVHITGSEEDLIEIHSDDGGMQFPTELVDMNELFANGQGAEIFGDLGDDSDDEDYEGSEGGDGGSESGSDSDEEDDDGGGGDGDGDGDDGDEADLVAEIETEFPLSNKEPSKKRRTRNSSGKDGVDDASAAPPAKKGKAAASSADDPPAERSALVKRGKGTLPLIEHRSGLKYRDVVHGVGKRVQRGHFVALQYTLRLENGKVVDKADRKRPFKFRVGIGECVKGFDIGVMGMREGGERHLIVPSDLGYGSQSLPGIPAGSTLYFDVSVVKAF